MEENNIKYEYTKTPLDYQITEYDCGTNTLLNALRYLFKRSEISPEIYKYIMQYTLDKSNTCGEIGKGGTSVYALEFLCNWLNENAKNKGMNIKCKSILKDEILFLTSNEPNPTNWTLPSFFNSSDTISIKALKDSSAAFLEELVFNAIAATNSLLFITMPPFTKLYSLSFVKDNLSK